MLDYEPDIPLISLHVPKCAGTSFERVLKQWFGQRLFLHYYNLKERLMPKKHHVKHRLFPWRYKRNICIHGHFQWTLGFGVTDYYPQIKQYITILRDPFEQAISNYFYKKNRGKYLIPFKDAETTVEEEFGDLESFLTGNHPTIPDFLPPKITLENYVDVFQKSFVYVGIVEDLQTSVNALAKKIAKPYIKIPHLNVSPRQIRLSDEQGIRTYFYEKNALSYHLYEYAKKNYQIQE